MQIKPTGFVFISNFHMVDMCILRQSKPCEQFSPGFRQCGECTPHRLAAGYTAHYLHGQIPDDNSVVWGHCADAQREVQEDLPVGVCAVAHMRPNEA